MSLAPIGGLREQVFGLYYHFLPILANSRYATQGLERIHNVATLLNARRHCLKHRRQEFSDLLCDRSGSCVDCNRDWRICYYTIIIKATMTREKSRTNTVLVGEGLDI